MDIRPIRNEADHAEALAEISRLMDLDPPEGTDDLDRLDVLATLVEAYEARIHPIGMPHPIDAIEIRMADKNIGRRQLCAMTGISESKLSEVMSRKRPLSLNMIRSIGPLLDLPVEILAQPYGVVQGQRLEA